MLIAQEGYYFGIILDNGFGTSSGGFPQEVLSLQAQQVYDPDSEEYVPVDPAMGTDLTWYGVLIDSKDNLVKLNCQQLAKVTGWSGADLVELSKADYSGKPIQFRVETKIWNEVPRLQVTWIDEEGAAPFRSVPKCSLEDAQALQVRYAGVLAPNKAPVAPASAPATPAAPPAKRKRRTKAEIAADKAACFVENPVPEGPPIEPDTATPAAKPVTAPATRPKMPGPAVVGKCTADEAWTAVATAKRDDVTEDQLADKWRQTILQHAPGGDEVNCTDETWFLVRRDVLAKTGKV